MIPLGSSDEGRTAVERAAAAAASFLFAAQDEYGRWRDFPEVGGGSDEWVTAYVGAALAAVPDSRARRAAVHAWRALCERPRLSGGWGYMPSYPPDADSTTCALRLAESLGVRRSFRAWRARTLLSLHQCASGGIATYAFPKLMARLTGLRASFDGWCSAHVCVTANAAHLARFRGHARVCRFLRGRQQSDGSWPAYWWSDCEYATALAAEALAQTGTPHDRDAVQRAAAWAARAPATDSAFATALRLRVMALADSAAELELPRRAAIERLLRAQLTDGSWPSAARLRFPPTHVVDPSCIAEWHYGQMVEAGVMRDERRLFTTATALTALHTVLKRAAPRRHDADLRASAAR